MSNTDLFDDGMDVQARANLRFGLEAKPDEVAQNAKLAQRYGLPPGVIAEYKPEYETRAKLDEANAVLDQSPKLRGWLAAEPQRAQIAHDDLDNMGLLETGASMLAKVPRAIASGLPALSAGLWGAAAFPTELVGLEGAGGWMRQQQRNAQGLANQVMGANPDAGLVEKSVLSGFQSAGQTLALLPLGFANGARVAGEQLMLGAMGLAAGGQSYGKGRDAGLSPAQAGAYGIQDATAEIVTEKFLGVAGLLKNVKAGASAGKLFGYEIFKELPGEGAATLWQNFNEWGNVNPDKSIGDFFSEQPEALMQTAIATLVGGGTQIGVIKGVESVMARANQSDRLAAQAEQHAQILQDLQTTMQAGKLLERSPETLTAYAQNLIDEGAGNVFVDSAKLIEAGVDLQALALAVPSVAAQLDQVQTGGDLVIPTAELLVGTIGAEFSQSLIDNARTDVGAMSRVEAKTYMQEKGDALNAEIESVMLAGQANTEFNAGREALQAQLLTQLNTVGRFTPKVNEHYATLAGTFYAVMAARTGVSVQDFANRYKLGFSGQSSTDGMYDQGKLAPDSEAFTNWFGDSKVVDTEGKPLQVYHGTKADIEAFVPSRGGEYGSGIYLTADEGAAGMYADRAGGEGGQNVMPVYVQMRNPYMAKSREKVRALGVKKLKNQGYDGIIATGPTGEKQYVAFDPTQIKSVFNRGTYDPKDANILHQGGVAKDPASAYTAPYETDLFGNPVPPPAGTAADQPDQQGVRGQLRPGSKVPGDTPAPAGEYLVNTHVATETKRSVGNAVVLTPAQAATATAYLYKSAVERFDGIVTDRKGKVLAVVGGFKGALTQASIYPGTVMAEAVRVPGAAYIWFSHNHPSGRASLSQADHNLNATMSEVFQGSGIEPMGLLAIAGDTFEHINPGNYQTPSAGAVAAPTKSVKVPVYERELTPGNGGGVVIDSPDTARAVAATYYKRAKEPGMLLLDAQLRVSAWVPITPAMQQPLRGGELNAVYRAVSQANAGNVIIVHGGELGQAGNLPAGITASQNIAAALQKVDVRALDSIDAVAGTSEASLGGAIAKGPLYQGGASNARGQIAFGNDITQQASIISMLSGADLSTFVHEGGHFFLEVHADLATKLQQEANVFGLNSLKPEERAVLDDFNTTLAWLGVTGSPELSALDTWYLMTPDEKRTHHEQWARGFEAYAFEGKSPSLELTKMFQTFRAWLVNVYRAMLKSVSASAGDIGGALKVELTDEVRAVMDRMLATNDQIAQAEAARNMGPLFKTPEEAGMTLDEYQRYHDAGKQATLDAVDALQAKGLADMQWLRNARSRKLKEMQKMHDTLRARIEQEVKADVMRQPLYRAWTFLTSKAGDKVVGDKPVGQSIGINPEVDNLFTAIAKLGGLDAAQVKAQWGYEAKNGAAESGVFGAPVVRKTKGYGLDAMAERLMEYGYLLPDENGKADLDKFEEMWDDQLRGVDRFSVHRDMAAAYGDAPLDVPELPDFGFGKLRTEDLRYMYGTQDDALWRKLSKLRMTSDETGLHPEVVAQMFGFESGDKLVKALADAQPPKEVIEGMTDQRMLQEHGDLATPAGLERATDAAIHNDARVRFVATELKALAQAMSVRGLIPGKKHTVDVLVQMAKAHAETVIARLKVRDIRPHQYAAAEARAAKAAEKALGDLTKQTMHKRNQLINLYATKAAYAAQDDIAKALAYFERVQKPGSIPAEHFEQIQALLGKFDLRKGTTLKSLDNAAQFRTWAKAQIDNGLVPPNAELLLGPQQRAKYAAEIQRTNSDGELIYPNEEDQALLLAGFIDQIEVRSYKEATVEEMRGLVQAIKQIEHIGRRTKKVLTDRKNREFDAVVARMTDHLSRVAIKAGRMAGDTRTPNDQKGQSRLSWRGFFFSHIKAANLLHIMDGGAGGPMWEHLMMAANDAANGEVVEVAMAHDAVQALLKPVKNLGNITDRAQYFPTIDRSLNRQARIVMALNLGNDGNRQRLLDGEGWTPAQIEPVLATLSAADWQFVQGMWDYYESFRPRVGAMERLINGVEPNWVEAVPLEVKTSDGITLQLRGGYAPVVYDPRANGKSASFADQKDAKAMMQAARVASTVSKSFVKARAEEVKGRPLLLSLNAMVGSLQDTIHYLHWQPWIIDANRLIKAMDAPMRRYYGSEVVHQLRQWAGDNAAGSQPTRNAAERKMVELARNVTFAGLAFNVLSAAKQVTGYTQSISVIGAKWMARGVAHSMRNPRQAYLQAVDKSSFMAKRATTRMRDLAEVNATVQDTGKVRKALDQGGYVMMLAMQSAVDVPTWWGGYEKAIDAGQDEDMAVALADQAVIDAQGSGLQKDLASLERATGAFRLLTGFMAFMNTTLNVNYRVLRSDQSVGAKAVDLVLVNALPTFMAMMLTAALTPGDSGEDDAQKLATKYLKEQMNFMLGQLVGFREIAQLGAAFAGDPGGDYGGAVGTRMAADILKLAKQVGQGDIDAPLRKSVVNAAGDMFKLPAAQINRTINGVEALADGKTQNPGAVLTGYQEPR